MDNCIFCQIAHKSIPVEIFFEDKDVIAFADIKPKAPLHYLIIPKKHYPCHAELNNDDFAVIAKLFEAAHKVAQKANIIKSGYRLSINSGNDSGMEINHLHLHLLGGGKLGGMC